VRSGANARISCSSQGTSIAYCCATSSPDTASQRRYSMAHDADDDARGAVAQRLFDAKAEWHRAQARLPVREKVRILLELQQQDLPLIARRRPLRSWERPWPVTP